jgi:hypothetical protein
MNLQITAPLDEAPIATTDDAVARVLGAAKLSDGAALLDALEARRVELHLSNATVEELAALPLGYVSKLVGPARLKSPTLTTVDRLMAALGLSWVLVIDPDKVARMRPAWRPRDQAHVRDRALSAKALERARPVVLAELARKAARPRWAGVDAKTFLKAMEASS